MKRVHSELFAPYRFLGVVTGDVPPTVRTTFVGKKSMLSVVCPVDNVLMHYNGKKLRLIGMSNSMESKITAVASTTSCVYAAHGSTISALPFCREVTDSIDIHSNIEMMTILGTNLIVVDSSSAIHVIDIETTLQYKLLMESEECFKVTAMVHPSTYLNKILVGSNDGQLRIINIRTGKVVHKFEREFGSSVTALVQTSALDVIAIGSESGEVFLHNIKLDKLLHVFRHESPITSIAFRNDGEAMMVTADLKGVLAVWNLDKQELIGKITTVHSDAVNCLHFISGEPILLSASTDNSLRLWIFDNADGMPRELVQLDGHSVPPSLAQFCTKTQLLSAEKNGSIRKYDVSSLTMRQKLGSIGSKSKEFDIDLQQEKNISAQETTSLKRAKADIYLNESNECKQEEEVVEMVVGWQKGETFSNVFCRQRNNTTISTWQSHNNSKGSSNLQHERFKTNVNLIDVRATSLCLSPCGNFVFVGYSSGHIDQFNAQSGRHVHTFSVHEIPQKKKANGKKCGSLTYAQLPSEERNITSLSIDQRGKELLGTIEAGIVIFWSLTTKKIVSKLTNKSARLGKSFASPSNSLIAIISASQKGKQNVVLVDTVCHRIVRIFENVGRTVNSIVFSADGKWLLIADDESYIRVFDVATCHMIDVLLFSKPCTSMSFNETGEFLATVHEGERAVYVWVNKAMFLPHVNIRGLDEDFLPSWGGRNNEPDVCIDDDDDVIHDEEVRAVRELQIDESLITFSGLPASRWANLLDLSIIKLRNKPLEAPKKIKNAPFFLSTTATIDGFHFQPDESLDVDLNSQAIEEKRGFLEMESAFSVLLKKAESYEDLLKVFDLLQDMSLSSVDFQIRTLSTKSIPAFLRMLLEALKTKKSFELVQSYLACAMKAHSPFLVIVEKLMKKIAKLRRSREFSRPASFLWVESIMEHAEMNSILRELLHEQDASWNETEMLFVENMSVVQWIKNALL